MWKFKQVLLIKVCKTILFTIAIKLCKLYSFVGQLFGVELLSASHTGTGDFCLAKGTWWFLLKSPVEVHSHSGTSYVPYLLHTWETWHKQLASMWPLVLMPWRLCEYQSFIWWGGINLLYLESQLLVILPNTLNSTLRWGESGPWVHSARDLLPLENTHRLKAENKRPGEEEIAQMVSP